MEKENSRRKFLKNLTITAVGSVFAAKTGNAMIDNVSDEKVIKSIKPLGFQWETQDPFLF